MIPAHYYHLLALLITGMVLSVWFKKLTTPAAVTGGICGLLVYAGAGYTGIVAMTAFFVTGTLATAWHTNEKQKLKAAEDDHGKRNTSQVLANAGVAAIAGMMFIILPAYQHLWALAIAASLSAATADTLASELGTVYGKRFYNIITWQPDQRGLDGVISLEGTLIGVGGSLLIAGIYFAGFGSAWLMAIVIFAGTIGNLADSILGAALERKGIIKNDAVNFLNTLIAALTAMGLFMVF
ncbi:DUF92 domain-containing protein [Mucilaginibacter terrae]|uniref:DUF92 domain-containing protein n=1 Tax=Mucilaginibacter terrae TaxID=1955052 RepID=UPI0036267427